IVPQCEEGAGTVHVIERPASSGRQLDCSPALKFPAAHDSNMEGAELGRGEPLRIRRRLMWTGYHGRLGFRYEYHALRGAGEREKRVCPVEHVARRLGSRRMLQPQEQMQAALERGTLGKQHLGCL